MTLRDAAGGMGEEQGANGLETFVLLQQIGGGGSERLEAGDLQGRRVGIVSGVVFLQFLADANIGLANRVGGVPFTGLINLAANELLPVLIQERQFPGGFDVLLEELQRFRPERPGNRGGIRITGSFRPLTRDGALRESDLRQFDVSEF